jgi:hypothetical protein
MSLVFVRCIVVPTSVTLFLFLIMPVYTFQLIVNTVILFQVNCISTEFTPKKHGGEKGVPFRIQVETYLQGEGTLRRLHAAACQIKVFKVMSTLLCV